MKKTISTIITILFLSIMTGFGQTSAVTINPSGSVINPQHITFPQGISGDGSGLTNLNIIITNDSSYGSNVWTTNGSGVLVLHMFTGGGGGSGNGLTGTNVANSGNLQSGNTNGTVGMVPVFTGVGGAWTAQTPAGGSAPTFSSQFSVSGGIVGISNGANISAGTFTNAGAFSLDGGAVKSDAFGDVLIGSDGTYFKSLASPTIVTHGETGVVKLQASSSSLSDLDPLFSAGGINPLGGISFNNYSGIGTVDFQWQSFGASSQAYLFYNVTNLQSSTAIADNWFGPTWNVIAQWAATNTTVVFPTSTNWSMSIYGGSFSVGFNSTLYGSNTVIFDELVAGGGNVTNVTADHAIWFMGGGQAGTTNPILTNGFSGRFIYVGNGTMSGIYNLNTGPPGLLAANGNGSGLTNLKVSSLSGNHTYFVSVAGNDSNPGTNLLAPLLTLTNALFLSSNAGINGSSNLIKLGFGRFPIPTNTYITTNTSIIGEGRYQTTLVVPPFQGNNSWLIVAGDNIYLKGFNMGSNIVTTGVYTYPLVLNNGTNFYMEDVVINGDSDSVIDRLADGINPSGGWISTFTGKIEHCSFYSGFDNLVGTVSLVNSSGPATNSYLLINNCDFNVIWNPAFTSSLFENIVWSAGYLEVKHSTFNITKGSTAGSQDANFISMNNDGIAGMVVSVLVDDNIYNYTNTSPYQNVNHGINLTDNNYPNPLVLTVVGTIEQTNIHNYNGTLKLANSLINPIGNGSGLTNLNLNGATSTNATNIAKGQLIGLRVKGSAQVDTNLGVSGALSVSGAVTGSQSITGNYFILTAIGDPGDPNLSMSWNEGGLTITQSTNDPSSAPLFLMASTNSTMETFHIEGNQFDDEEAFFSHKAGVYNWEVNGDGALQNTGIYQQSAYINPSSGPYTFDVAPMNFTGASNQQNFLAVNCSNATSILIEYPIIKGAGYGGTAETATNMGWVYSLGGILGNSNTMQLFGTRVDSVDANTLTICAIGHPGVGPNGQTNFTVPPGASWKMWSEGTNLLYSLSYPFQGTLVSNSVGVYRGGGKYVWTNAPTFNSIFIPTNSIAPAAVAGGGYLWCSNDTSLFWITTTHTNKISAP